MTIVKNLLGWLLLVICLGAPAGYVWHTRADQSLTLQALLITVAIFLLALFASWLISIGEKLS